MAKLMWIAGILLVAVGAALGVMAFVSTIPLEAYGVRLELAGILLVGGILSLGLGSVINLLRWQRLAIGERAPATTVPSAPIPEFGRKAAEAAPAAAAAAAPAASRVAAAAAPAAAPAAEEVSGATRDTIKALEQARQKIEQAFEGKPAAAEEPPPPEPEEFVQEEVVADGQLYVVEERFIRLRPARILSDGTVEAETEEGWMRFENLEHLDEYLDAMEPAKG